MKRKWIFGLAGAAVLFAAIFFQIYRSSLKPPNVIVRRSAIKQAIYGIGTVVSKKHFFYKVSLMKTVDKLFVREGDSVREGQPLLQMSESGVVRSPIEGVVTYLPYSAGENTEPGLAIVIVQNLEQLYVKASLEQQSALQVRRGLKATLSFESLRGQIFEGQVHSVFSKDNQFYAIIDVDKLPPQVLPDMTAEVAIQVAEKKDALVIPIQALSVGFVTKLDGNNRTKIPVSVGLIDDEWAEIISNNLREGDQLLIPKR